MPVYHKMPDTAGGSQRKKNTNGTAFGAEGHGAMEWEALCTGKPHVKYPTIVMSPTSLQLRPSITLKPKLCTRSD